MSILLGFILLAVSAGLVSFPLVCAIVLSVACVFLNLGYIGYSYKKQKKYVLYQAYSFFYLFQPIAFLALLILYPYDTQEFIASTRLLTGRPFSLVISFTLVPFMGYLYSRLLVFLDPKQPPSNEFFASIKQNHQLLGPPLSFAAIVNLLAWFFDVFPLYVSYFVRVIWAAFQYTAFLAGMSFSLKSKHTYVWGIALISGLVLAGVTGSRGYAFWPFLFYFIGFVLQLKPTSRLWILTLAMLVMPMGVKYLGFIDSLRQDIGRVSITERDREDLKHGIKDALSSMNTEGIYSESSDKSAGYKGLRRLVDWTLVVVPAMSPERIPYRGYKDIHIEIGSILYYGGFNLTSGWVRPYLSVMYARDYGFRVYKSVRDGKVHSTSVPFNIVADSYSRFGVVSSMVQVLFYMYILTVFEKICRKLFRHDPIGYLMVITYLFGHSFYYSNVYNLTKNFRSMVLYFSFIVVTMKVFSIYMKLFDKRNPNVFRNH